MSKMTNKRDHETSHSLAREVYASNILDSSLHVSMDSNDAVNLLTRLLVLTLFHTQEVLRH
ncbi:Uncharacterised protein [Salmonella enterica]|uniref:Uncharacterized protein n=1 Tax=Salmonella enterica TaxID=28901 RepID=A0A379SE59_SALER|nr:Uncharacterised protein [Salmonella enterica]